MTIAVNASGQILMRGGGGLWAKAEGGGGDGDPVGGQHRDVFAYLNSLHNHDAGDGNANTSVANWVKRMADDAPNGGNGYTLGSQFGFADGWSLPPAVNGQEEVTSLMTGGSWTNGSGIDVLEMVPDNFEGPGYDPSETNGFGFAYTTRLLQIIDSWEANAPNASRVYAVYAGWPDMSPYGDPSTLTAPQKANYIAWALGGYQDWMEEIVVQLRANRPALDIRLHNINKATITAWRDDPVVSAISASTLFEDDAPHGRASWYFLAAVADYIEIYNEKPPVGFVFDGGWGVNSAITTNYQAIVDSIYATLRPTQARFIGAHVAYPTDYVARWFVDEVSQSRGFSAPGAYSESTSIGRDANGYPTEASDLILMISDGVTDDTSFVGTYSGSYDDAGSTSISLTTGVNATLTGVSRTGTHVTFNLNVTDHLPDVVLSFNGAITNLSIKRPGYSGANQFTLLDEVVTQLKKFWCLRFMDWTGGNNAADTTWASRVPASKTHGRKSLELAFHAFSQAYNAAGSKTKAMWVNVPHMADQDYMENFAALAHSLLPAGAILYVEYSNELWNSSFSQGPWLQTRADDTGDPDYSVISVGGVDSGTRMRRLWGLKTARMAKAFIDEFGPGSFGTVVRPVHAGQGDWYANWTQPALEFLNTPAMEALYGDPSTYIYALSAAAYLNPNYAPEGDATTATTAEAMLALMAANSAEVIAGIEEWETARATFGIEELNSYEWGLHPNGPANSTGAYLSAIDPGVRTLLNNHFNDSWGAGLTLINYFSVGADKKASTDANTLWSTMGYWGEPSQKVLAILDQMIEVGQ